MIPKIAHFVWLDDETGPCPGPSRLRQHSMDEFERLNPGWDVRRHYEKVKVEKGYIANLADCLTYRNLARDGGLSIESDILFYEPFPEEYLDTDLLLSMGKGTTITQMTLMGAAAGSPFFNQAETEAFRRMAETKEPDYQLVGTTMLTSMIADSVRIMSPGSNVSMRAYCAPFGLRSLDLPYELVLPFDSNEIPEAHAAIRAGAKPVDSIGIHWFGGHPSSDNLQKWWANQSDAAQVARSVACE